jgi:hypothetical protein
MRYLRRLLGRWRHLELADQRAGLTGGYERCEDEPRETGANEHEWIVGRSHSQRQAT